MRDNLLTEEGGEGGGRGAESRSAKRKFEKKLADGYSGNSRPFYSYIKKKTKSRPSIGPLKDKKEKVVTEDQEMAEVLNEFFSSVFLQEKTPQMYRRQKTWRRRRSRRSGSRSGR